MTPSVTLYCTSPQNKQALQIRFELSEGFIVYSVFLWAAAGSKDPYSNSWFIRNLPLQTPT